MSDEATGKAGKTWLYVVGVLLSFPLLYALSLGPAVVLVQRKIIAEPVLQPVYAPLESFIKMTGLESAAREYVVAWLRLTGTPNP